MQALEFKIIEVDIIEVISDALYSDSEAVIDAAAELLDTLLKKNAEDTATMESLSLVSNFMQNASGASAAAGLMQTEEAMKLREAERDAILVELVSAVGLQRLRFDSGTFWFGLVFFLYFLFCFWQMLKLHLTPFVFVYSEP